MPQGVRNLKIVGQASLPVVAARASWLAPHLRAVTVPAMPTSSVNSGEHFHGQWWRERKKLAHHRQAGPPVQLIQTPPPGVSPGFSFANNVTTACKKREDHSEN